MVTGHDRADIGLLVFPTPQASALSPNELQAAVVEGMRKLRAEGGGSSQSPTRALIQHEPPSAEGGEITDKGYINQRAVLSNRKA